MTKEEYWFWLCNIKDIHNDQIRKLLNIFISPVEVFNASEKQLKQSNLSEKEIASIIKEKKNLSFINQLSKLSEDGISFIYPEHALYPEKLKQLKDFPYSLYLKGKLPNSDLSSVAMVGARACSEYGKTQSIRFAKSLALEKIQIISGLALGIDSICAKAALEVGGKTFAVLGSGIDVIYPRENIELYYEIIINGGGIISEYPLGTPPYAWQFPSRNRLISGLSDKVLIMEARNRSGTLITAQYALEQGKDIYCLPGKITDKLSEGCNKLISDGAGVLLSPEYFLSDLSNEHLCPLDTNSDKFTIYNLLGNEPMSTEDLLQKTSLSPESISTILMDLEISGLIREVSKNYYIKSLT